MNVGNRGSNYGNNAVGKNEFFGESVEADSHNGDRLAGSGLNATMFSIVTRQQQRSAWQLPF